MFNVAIYYDHDSTIQFYIMIVKVIISVIIYTVMCSMRITLILLSNNIIIN